VGPAAAPRHRGRREVAAVVSAPSPRAVDLGTRDRILDAAQELIARYGTTGMSLQLLADHVGLHKSTLFHHFPDKASLIDAVTRRLMREVVERLEPLAADDPPEIAHFVAVAESLDGYFADRPRSALFVMREILGPNDLMRGTGQSAETQQLFGLISGWLARARDAGVIRPLSIRQAIVNLMGLSLFYPALIDQIGDEPPFGFARSPEARASRRRELGQLVELFEKGDIHFSVGSCPAADDIVAAVESNGQRAVDAAQAVSDDRWDAPAKFFMGDQVVWEAKVSDMAWGYLFDMVHHRGQLSAYIRPMGGKVPAIYGPSADDSGS